MIFTLLLFVLSALALIAQDFIPVIDWAYHSRVFVVPVVFFAAAISVPYPVMLMLAFFTGFLWDARNLVTTRFEDVAELAHQIGVGAPQGGVAFGFSIFLYALLGSLIQGIRPLFRRGRWELPVLMTGICTFLLLLIEYLWINFRRGGFVFPVEVWYHLVTTALLSMFVAPLAFFFIDRLACLSGYYVRYEGLTRRRWT